MQLKHLGEYDPEDSVETLIAELLDHHMRLRDREEIELKLDFLADNSQETNFYTQDFFFFIPSSLQVNSKTYSKKKFYRDQTSFVRFKTPSLSINELLDSSNGQSPLACIKRLIGEGKNLRSEKLIEELKLLGAISRSYVRNQVGHILSGFEKKHSDLNELLRPLEERTLALLADLKALRSALVDLGESLKKLEHSKVELHPFEYVDEFIGLMVNHHLSFILQKIAAQKEKGIFDTIKKNISSLMLSELKYREDCGYTSIHESDPEKQTEYFLYRRNLLKKYVLNVLQLETHKEKVAEKFIHFVGAFAAGLAMLIYLVLIGVLLDGTLPTSSSLLIIAVILYMGKDRIKEGVKILFHKMAPKLFPDYRSSITLKDRGSILGRFAESCDFIPEKKRPKWLKKIRNDSFHTEVTEVKRIDDLLHYQREIKIFPKNLAKKNRYFNLNNILRFNLYAFTRRASRPTYHEFVMDSETGELGEVACPRVYHINLVLLSSYHRGDERIEKEIKCFRIVMSKLGITRIERIS